MNTRISYQAVKLRKRTRSSTTPFSILFLALVVSQFFIFSAYAKNFPLISNFVLLTLIDKITGDWSTDNSAISDETEWSFAEGPPPPISVVMEQFTPHEDEVIPYELKVTATPTNSYACGTNSTFWTNIIVIEHAYDTNSVTLVSGTTTNITTGLWEPYNSIGDYTPGDGYTTNAGTAANPILYAFDTPGIDTNLGLLANDTNVAYVTHYKVLKQDPQYMNTNNGTYYTSGSTNTVTVSLSVSYYTNSIGSPPTNCFSNTPHWSGHLTKSP